MAYTLPTPSDLKARYPAFAAVADETVQYWLTDAERIVTTDWFESDYQPALMSLAAHNMAGQGYGSAGGAVADLGAMGVTSFRSASMSVSFTESVVAAGAAGGYSSSRYGREFVAMLRRNRGGPFLAGCA